MPKMLINKYNKQFDHLDMLKLKILVQSLVGLKANYSVTSEDGVPMFGSCGHEGDSQRFVATGWYSK